MSARRVFPSIVLLASIVLLTTVAAPAIAVDYFNGVKFTIQNPGDPSQRRIVASGGRRLGNPSIFGNPDADGGSATLTVRLDGGDSATEAFVLPQGTSASGRPFWKFVAVGGAGGWVYRDPHGEQGPVSLLVMKVTVNHIGTTHSFFKAIISGKYAPLSLVPPNPGTAAWVTVQVSQGPLYCAGYGDATITNVGDRRFSVRNPQDFGCPPL